MLKWYQEPILHFIVLGTFLFFIIKWNSPENREESSRVIVVKQEDIDRVNYIQDEILYREALDRNLDKDDEGIKQLLVDKLKYTMSDSLNITEVSSEVLEEYFMSHKNSFAKESQIILSFGHIYLNPQEHSNIDLVAKNLLEEVDSLVYDKSMAKKGDKYYAGSYFKSLTRAELYKAFSWTFINDLVKLPVNKWSMLKSGFGIHLIYIEDIEKREIKFKDVKNRVKDAYIIEKNANAYREFYEEVKEKYEIIIENNKSKSGHL